ncbi:MAG: hypothetical protein SGCHY_004444 [Lobulomycetales sp.]
MTIASSQDVRPILKLMRSINPDDLPAAWEAHKQKLRGSMPKPAAASGGLFSRSAAAGPGVTVFDIIERAAVEERAHFKKEQVENVAAMKEMRKQAEEEQKRQIEEMKKKKMKMFDYLFATQPPQAPASPNTN